MLWMIVYFTVGYLMVLVALVALYKCWEKPSKLRWATFALVLSAPLLPYLFVFFQTLAFGSFLRPHVLQAMKESGMLGDKIAIMRIMEFTPWFAEVYVAEPCSTNNKSDTCLGVIVNMRRSATGWHLADWAAVWSDQGSAHGNTFPPYPEGE